MISNMGGLGWGKGSGIDGESNMRALLAAALSFLFRFFFSFFVVFSSLDW
jgi:hypothetical protein